MKHASPSPPRCVGIFAALAVVGCAVLIGGDGALRAADPPPVFSGPQAGEALPPFEILGVYDDDAGKRIDPIERSGQGATLIIFVHKLTRPSAGLTRSLASYATSRAKDGLRTTVVWLDDDRSAAEAYLKRARNSLRLTGTVGISVDGGDGPGAYGLNRKVTLTILVGKSRKVTANFALVQPSDRDGTTILKSITDLIGGKAPPIRSLRMARDGGRNIFQRLPKKLQSLLRRMRKHSLNADKFESTVAEIERFVADDRKLQRRLGQLSRMRLSRQSRGKQHVALNRQWSKWENRYAPKRDSRRDPRLAELLRAAIQKDIEPQDALSRIAEVEEYAKSSETIAKELGDIARRVVEGDIFARGGYGGSAAREALQRWSKTLGAPSTEALDGLWLLSYSTPDGTPVERLLCFTDRRSDASTVHAAKLRLIDQKVSFQATVAGDDSTSFSGKLDGDVIRGTVQVGDPSQAVRWTAQRLVEL